MSDKKAAHNGLAELIGRTARAIHPDARAVLTVIVLPQGGVTLGGAFDGVDHRQAMQALTFTLRETLAQLERNGGKAGPLILMPGGTT